MRYANNSPDTDAPRHMRLLKKHMPRFIHELPGAKVLFEILGAEKSSSPS